MQAPPRPRLRDVELTGTRRQLRAWLLGMIALLSGFGAVRFVSSEHRASGSEDVVFMGPWHSPVLEGLLLPVVAPALVVVAVAWAWRGGLWRGLVAAAAPVKAGFLVLLSLELPHLLTFVESSPDHAQALSAVMCAAALGRAMLVVIPLLHVRERHAARAAQAPVFPTARVVQRER